MVTQRTTPPLLLSAAAVRRALSPAAAVEAVEDSLGALDRGALQVAPTVHLPGTDGGHHLKSAYALTAPHRSLVKINGNFPQNSERYGLPTIQGVALLLDGERGNVLAILDSPALTALRTAAVSTVAARRLALPETRRLALVGCGVQALAHLESLATAFRLETVRLFDSDRAAAERLARRARELGLAAEVAPSVHGAARGAELIVTSTTARSPILFDGDVAPGAFVAAVGADNPEKVELSPELLARSRVVVDSLPLAAASGDLRLALATGAMRAEDVHGELPALVAGRVPARTRSEERFVFDSTGLAATDLAVASLAYDSARREASAPSFDFTADAEHAPAGGDRP